MIECDVLVIGAGPAGSMTAKTIAEGGYKVIIVERNSEVGIPVRCAEAINPNVFQDTNIDKNQKAL